MANTVKARFSIGDIVQHNLFGYRGVIIDVDSNFQGDENWYELNAPGHPPKNKPWYHLLVHGSIHYAYAAEMNLIIDNSQDPIEHPEIDYFFSEFKKGHYRHRGYNN